MKSIYQFLIEQYGDPTDADYEYYEKSDNLLFSILDAFRSKNSNFLKFRVIPNEQYHRALQEFMKTGTFLRFPEKTIHKWKDLVIDNIIKLNHLTALAGHTNHFPSDQFRDFMFDEDDPETDKDWTYNEVTDYMEENDWYSVWPTFSNGQDVLSDYGLSPLLRLARELVNENNPDKIIVIINKIFDVAHQRSDLAELFIEGGSKSLDYISNN